MTGGDVHPDSLTLGFIETNLAARLSVRQGNFKITACGRPFIG